MTFSSRSITNHLSTLNSYIQETNASEEQASTCSESITLLAESIHRFDLNEKLSLLEKLQEIKSKQFSLEAPRKRRRLSRTCNQIALNSLEMLNGKATDLEDQIINELWEKLWTRANEGNREEVLKILSKDLPSEIVIRIFYPFDHSRSFFALSQHFGWHDVAEILFNLYPIHSHALSNFSTPLFSWDENIVPLAIQYGKGAFLSAFFSHPANSSPEILRNLLFTGKEHETILHFALRCGQVDIFLFLLSQVHSICPEPAEILLKTDLDDNSIFDLPGVKDNNAFLETVFSQIKGNLAPYLTYRNENGESLLHISCRLGIPSLINLVFKDISKLPYEKSLELFEPNYEGRGFLHLACVDNNAPVIRALFSQCKILPFYIQNKLFLPDQDEDTALHLACAEGRHDLAKLIIEETLKLQRLLPDSFFSANSRDETIFHLATSSESLPLVKQIYTLLREARDPLRKKAFTSNRDGDTIAHLACKTNDRELMAHVFSIIQDYPASMLKNIFAKNFQGKSFFHIVCSFGEAETLSCALAFFQDLPLHVCHELWSPDKENNTPLHLAVKSGDDHFAQQIQALLEDLPEELLIDCYAPNKSGKTVVHLAFEEGLEDFVESLFLRTANLDSYLTQDFWAADQTKKTALHYAFRRGSPRLARAIFKQLGRLSEYDIPQFLSPDSEGNTFLHHALKLQNHELSELAFTQIAHYSKKIKKPLFYANGLGKSILHLSVSQNNAELTKLILEESSQLKNKEKEELFLPDKLGQTPLHLACKQGNCEIALMIMNVSKNLSIHISEGLFSPDACGYSILHIACHYSNLPLLQLIFSQLQYFPTHLIHRLFFPNPRGDTILHYVCKSNRTAAARFMFSQIQKLPGNLIIRMLQENAIKYTPLEFDYSRVWTRSLLAKLTKKQILRLLDSLSDQMRNSCLLMLHEQQVRTLPMGVQLAYRRIVGDRKLEINRDHFQKKVGIEFSNPNTPDLDIGSLGDMLRETNFSFPDRPAYKDPATLKNDDNEAVSVSEILKGLDLMIHRVKNRVPFLGTPSAEHPEELERFYQNIEISLKHIIHALQKTPKEERVQYLAQLGVAGQLCGGRYISETQYMFSLLSGFTSEHFDQLTIEHKILSCLHDLRFTIFHELLSFLAKGPSVDAHHYALYMRSLGKEIGLQSNSLAEFNDPFSSQQVHMDLMLHRFHSRYTPTVLIDEVSNFFNNVVMKNSESRNLVIDWFKENAPKRSDPVSYLTKVFEDTETWKLKRKYIVILLKRLKILKRAKFADLLFS